MSEIDNASFSNGCYLLDSMHVDDAKEFLRIILDLVSNGLLHESITVDLGANEAYLVRNILYPNLTLVFDFGNENVVLSDAVTNSVTEIKTDSNEQMGDVLRRIAHLFVSMLRIRLSPSNSERTKARALAALFPEDYVESTFESDLRAGNVVL